MSRITYTRIRRVLVIGAGIAAIAVAVAGFVAYRDFMGVPATRLGPGAFYGEMPPDTRHIYLGLPVDHAQPDGPTFRGFYILSQTFSPTGPVVFCFTDGQMELVDTQPDMAFFDAQLPGLSYVVVGHRGHRPSMFPEVYKNGHVDRAAARRLYSSAQRIEDLERVRQDMVKRGLLAADGRIMIFAASGAGVLAQAFLERHGSHVSRVLLASTGAPDLARQLGVPTARSFADYDAGMARDFAQLVARGAVDRERASYLLYQLGRSGVSGRATQHRVLSGLLHGNLAPYMLHLLNPQLNWSLLRVLMASPAEDAVKVRMEELIGDDLRRLQHSPGTYDSLLYPWAAEVLAPYLDDPAPDPFPAIDRSTFAGDVLVITGSDDTVFAPAIGRAIAGAYPHGRFLAVRGGHRLELDAGYHGRIRRAFFREGLNGQETAALLATSPN